MDELHTKLDITEQILAITIKALETCSTQQQEIYQLVHGVYKNGNIAEPMTLEQAARTLQWSRGAARWHLAIAQATIYKHLAVYFIAKEQKRIEEEKIPLPGDCIPDYKTELNFYDPQMTIKYRTNTKNGINLGAGSEAMEKAAKAGGLERRITYTMRAHNRYAK